MNLETLDSLYYSDIQVQKNIDIRSRLPDYKARRASDELEAKKWWLLNHWISKKDIETAYWRFKTYVYFN